MDPTEAGVAVPVAVGIDGGGSQTTAVAVGARGDVVAQAVGGSSNLKAVGWDTATAQLQQVLGSLAAALPPDAEVVGLHAALAGAGRSEEAEQVRAGLLDCCRLAALRQHFGRLAPEAIAVSHDALAVLASAGDEVGIVVIAGTGSLVWGRNRAGATSRAGGWGYLLGDEGSGFDLGRRALIAVLAAFDGRREPTALTEAVLAHFTLAAPPDLVSRIYDSPGTRTDIASVAPLALRLAEEGDRTAHSLVALSVQALAGQVRPVALRLGLANDDFPIVCSGGMFRNAAFFQALAAAVADVVPAARCCRPRQTPAEGAALLAWRRPTLAGVRRDGA